VVPLQKREIAGWRSGPGRAFDRGRWLPRVTSGPVTFADGVENEIGASRPRDEYAPPRSSHVVYLMPSPSSPQCTVYGVAEIYDL
jgi:hypothetical protein